MTFDDPEPLTSHFKNKINHQNIHDNFFKCPAFLNNIKNMYSLNAPWDIDVEFLPNGSAVDNSTKKPANLSQMYQIKNSSMVGASTVNIFANWIFFSEDPVYIQTSPPFLHKSSMANNGFYVPGSYDISQWFRPIEGAIQLWPGEHSLRVPVGDPFIYINFLTDEPIEFKRFFMTKDIHEISQNCARFKQFKTIKNLDRLYDIFVNRGLRKRLLEKIKENLV
jgi:hypothetical protein